MEHSLRLYTNIKEEIERNTRHHLKQLRLALQSAGTQGRKQNLVIEIHLRIKQKF